MTEMRTEICNDCGHEFEREWVTKNIPKGTLVPTGWRVRKRGGSWKTIEARTRWTTLCMCDVAV
jgi:hypothetical protein